MNKDQFRKAASAVVEDVINYFTSLPGRRVTPSISPGYLRPQLPSSAPEEPEPFEKVLEDVDSKIVPGLTHWQSPRFMAFFPALTTYPSILGEIYSAAFSAPAFNWICSPACTELETVVLDWVCKALGLPECYLSESANGGGGVIQGSASEAVVVCMIAARERAVRAVLEREGLAEQPGESTERERQREDRAAEVRSKLVALGSAQAHSCTQKAATIAGVRFRTVPTRKEDGLRMMGTALREKLEACEREGLQPFYVTATLGTTGTCAIDDFEGIANQVKLSKYWKDVWVHIDAAYAGAALVCEETREAAGVKWYSHVDSFNFNMHKWMLVNFDASCLFVRNRRDLIAALSISPSYLVNNYSLSGHVTDYRDWQIPLGRRFRALKIWFVLRTYGLKRIQEMVRKHIALGETFASLVTSTSSSAQASAADSASAKAAERGRLEVLYGPAFGLTVVRCVAPASFTGESNLANGHGQGEAQSTIPALTLSEEQQQQQQQQLQQQQETKNNTLTRQVYELINARGEFFLTSFTLPNDGTYAIRVVSANELAEEKYIRRCHQVLCETMQEIVAKG